MPFHSEKRERKISKRSFILELPNKLRVEYLEECAATRSEAVPNNIQHLRPKQKQCQVTANCSQNKTKKYCYKCNNMVCGKQSRSTPTSGPPPKVSARAPAHRSYHFRGVKLKSCIKKIHHNLYISKQANVRIKHADTEGASHKKFGTDARVQ